MHIDLQARFVTDGWFGSLPARQQHGLLGRGQIHDVESAAHVYRIGDPPNGLHAVVAGQVRLVSYPAAGQELVNMIVRPGRWFGELSVIDGKERPHDAIAAGPARVLTVPMTAIGALAADMPGLWHSLALLTCAHHRLGMREAARVRSLPALVRLARFLAGGGERAGGLPLRLTQDDLARVVGVSRQHINGLLRHLADGGLIATGYGGVAVLDPGGLLSFADREERG